MKETFGQFVGRNWWLLLISLAHIFRGGEEFTGYEKLLITIVGIGIILFLMFLYWSYHNRK